MEAKTLERALRFTRGWLAERYEAESIPGFVAAVAHQGTVVLSEAHGYADLERRVPMTTGHVFRIASHSKTFTATTVMQLAEEGRLRIDDPAASYLPWLKGHKDGRWANVTLRQLLSHGAGVIRDGLRSNFWHLERPFPDAEAFIAEMRETDLVLDNNLKMKYSNYGYTVLGLVIEAVTGQPYNAVVAERVVAPLNLRQTHPDYRPELPADFATGYTRRVGGGRLPIDHVGTGAMSAATGFCSTAEDICAYFTAQMVGSGKLLSDESKKEMQRAAWPSLVPGQPSKSDYGLGFDLRRSEERKLFGHGGGFPGFITRTMADGEGGLVITALTNAVDGPAESIVLGIHRILRYFEQHAPTSGHDWSALEGRYANLWGTTNVIAADGGLVTVTSAGWDPLAAPNKLEWVEDRTFRITECASGGNEGELLRFHPESGALERSGTLSWTSDEWRRMLAGRTRISLE
jgi:D-alanyl-D-alanine carboxypeptidase